MNQTLVKKKLVEKPISVQDIQDYLGNGVQIEGVGMSNMNDYKNNITIAARKSDNLRDCFSLMASGEVFECILFINGSMFKIKNISNISDEGLVYLIDLLDLEDARLSYKLSVSEP